MPIFVNSTSKVGLPCASRDRAQRDRLTVPYWFATPTHEFRACPTHKNFVGVGIWYSTSTPPHRQTEKPIRRYDPDNYPLLCQISLLRDTRAANLAHSTSPFSATEILTIRPAMSSKKTQRSAIADVVAREYTINMHKRVCLSPDEPVQKFWAW
jgi:hypothetical protein